MKTVRISLFLFGIIVIFVILNSLFVQENLVRLQAVTTLLPDDAESLGSQNKDDIARCRALSAMWDRLFPYFSFVCSYAELNRADEALIELTADIRSGSGENALAAKHKFEDALRRLYELEGISISAVF